MKPVKTDYANTNFHKIIKSALSPKRKEWAYEKQIANALFVCEKNNTQGVEK